MLDPEIPPPGGALVTDSVYVPTDTKLLPGMTTCMLVVVNWVIWGGVTPELPTTQGLGPPRETLLSPLKPLPVIVIVTFEDILGWGN
jgi:hypothetical protein